MLVTWLVTNIQNLSPTHLVSSTRHQHRYNRLLHTNVWLPILKLKSCHHRNLVSIKKNLEKAFIEYIFSTTWCNWLRIVHINKKYVMATLMTSYIFLESPFIVSVNSEIFLNDNFLILSFKMTGKFKASSDPSHFIYEVNVGKSRIRHRTIFPTLIWKMKWLESEPKYTDFTGK